VLVLLAVVGANVGGPMEWRGPHCGSFGTRREPPSAIGEALAESSVLMAVSEPWVALAVALVRVVRAGARETFLALPT
jgi:hypothetical protein